MQRKLVDLRTAAEYLGISHHFLYKLTARKDIGHIRIGRKILFDIKTLEKFISDHSIEPIEWAEKYGVGNG